MWKKPWLSLREVLKQRLCFHLLVKLAESTQYWNTTTGLQLKPKGVAQRYRTNTFFLSFWKSLGCEEEKDILSSKLLLFSFFFCRENKGKYSVSLFLIRKERIWKLCQWPNPKDMDLWWQGTAMLSLNRNCFILHYRLLGLLYWITTELWWMQLFT